MARPKSKRRKIRGWLPKIHPNGFWIAILAAFRGLRLRLHYWPPDSKILDTPHNHRSWFISLPLWGVLEEWRFELDDGDDYRVLRCMSTSSRSGPATQPAGTGSVKPVKRRFRLPLIPYFCPASAIHSTIPRTNRVVTIVLFGKHQKVPRAWIKQSDVSV